MKTVVIYHSQTGFTKRYAQWIAEAAKAESSEVIAEEEPDDIEDTDSSEEDTEE